MISWIVIDIIYKPPPYRMPVYGRNNDIDDFHHASWFLAFGNLGVSEAGF